MPFLKQQRVPIFALLVGLGGGALFLLSFYYADTVIKTKLADALTNRTVANAQGLTLQNSLFGIDARFALLLSGAGIVMMTGAIYWLVVSGRSKP